MFGVVCLHTTYYYFPISGFNLSSILYQSAVISIPLFFMVSGYLLLGRKDTDYRYSLGKIWGIARFVLTLSLSIWFCRSLRSGEFVINDFMRALYAPFIQKGKFFMFWYLGTMIILYLLLPLLNNLVKKRYFFIIAFVILIIVRQYVMMQNIVSSAEVGVIQTFRLWNWMFFFVLGGAIRHYDIHLPNSILLGAIAVLSMVNVYFQNVFIPMIGNNHCEYFYSSAPVSMMCLSVFLFLRNTKVSDNKTISVLSEVFLPVYTLHFFIVREIKDYFLYDIDLGIILFATVSFLSLFISFVVVRVPFLNRIFKL